MKTFKDFLRENEEDVQDELTPEELQEIQELLDDMSDEEVDLTGVILYAYFDDPEDSEEEDPEDEENLDAEFTREDVLALVQSIGKYAYALLVAIQDANIQDEDELFDFLDDYDFSVLSETVAKRMLAKNFLRARVYQKITRAKLRATVASRKRLNRLNRNKKRRYYRLNKRKLKMYKKSRAKAVQTGRHRVKLRR